MKGYKQLSLDERYTMKSLLNRGFTVKEVAEVMDRHVSTLYRELKRNLRKSGRYTASIAQSRCNGRRRLSRKGSQYSDEQWKEVNKYLSMAWIPEQISGKFKLWQKFNISYQTIYRMVKKDRKAGGEIYKNLRIMPKVRRKRYATADSRGVLPGKRHISTRPEQANDRSEQGHWEGDTVMGGNRKECVLTLVDRKTGFSHVRKLKARTSKDANRALMEIISEAPDDFKTITFDNGTEFHSYKKLEAKFPVICYFATPHHSWERGCNENFNGLLRQYLPKGSSMKSIGNVKTKNIVLELNNRQRKRLGYYSPAEVYYVK